jgi:thiopeptide-type bacteriocin biosynthesis protein
MNKVHAYLHDFKTAGYIWKMQLDAYSREIERYGNATMELTETLFCYDSIACVDMLDNTWGDERDHVRWLWALRSVEELLECFGFSTAEKHELMLRLSTSFGAEFNMDRSLKLQLNNKYRANKQVIAQIMDRSAAHPHETLIEILHTRSQHIMPLAEKINTLQQQGALEVPLLSLLGSYIHMMINRIAAADARMQEMVIYSLLESYYRSMIARTKQMTSKM